MQQLIKNIEQWAEDRKGEMRDGVWVKEEDL